MYSENVQRVLQNCSRCIWKIFHMYLKNIHHVSTKGWPPTETEGGVGIGTTLAANLNFSWMLRILVDISVYFNIAWAANVFPIWWGHNSRKMHQMHVIFLRIIDMLQNTPFLVSVEGCGTLLVNWFFTGTKKYHFNFSNIKVYPLLAKDALSPRVAGYNRTNEIFWQW